MKFSVKALPVKDVIKDLAKQWQVEIQEDCGEFIIELPNSIGTGFVRGTSFSSGIGVIEYKGTFFQDTEIIFSIDDIHPLKFIFCSAGKVEQSFREDQQLHTINTFQNVIVSSSGKNGHVLHFTADEKVHVASIEIIRKIFSERKNHHFKKLSSELKQLFKDSNAEKKFFYRGNYSIKSADIMEEIDKKEFTGFLRSLFLEGKLLEMLVFQIFQYQDDLQEDRLPQIMRQSDIEKVNTVRELIHSNIDQNYSVDFLAKEAGTNVNKLQEGFKYIFHLTVNRYMHQVKLSAAKDLLISSEYNISEIVRLIGLNNRSYFSKMFKEKYGVSPKYFLQSRKENAAIDGDMP